MPSHMPSLLRRRSRARSASSLDAKSSPVIVVPRADFKRMLESDAPDPAPSLRELVKERHARLA